ncbi:hypothetical protein FD977_06840 [Polynucleobacter sp. AP-Elch-400A-B2]|uniref:hypothetical protein n=1 Tax=Polynucleobacter sp. AP-Elch-400A-B2 TaxID=2576930 RepID=UPI001BFDF80F|nr:hypothetical protein [Polynucleobacter sp. AP-Elch-400A-B2]QWE23989.1 hypothetical protein FD977_06840 [Polynucleobacter sp. AP-Elch-400A-B2]
MNLSRLVSITKSQASTSQGDSKRQQNPSSHQSNSIWEDALEKATCSIERLR